MIGNLNSLGGAVVPAGVDYTFDARYPCRHLKHSECVARSDRSRACKMSIPPIFTMTNTSQCSPRSTYHRQSAVAMICIVV